MLRPTVLHFAILLSLPLGVWADADASTPDQMTYQGRLFGPSGAVLDSTLAISFTIYSDSTGGSLLWSESQSVPVDSSLFNVILGSVTPIPSAAFTGTPRWLTMQIAGDTEMVPRVKLVSVPYSFRAEKADTSQFAVNAARADTSDFAFSGPGSGGDTFWGANGNDIHNLNSGNVGVGTNTPPHKLTVTGGALAVETGSLYLASDRAVQFNYGVANDHYIRKEGTNLTFSTGGAYCFSNGNVGIGTTTPSAKLDAAGAIAGVQFNTHSQTLGNGACAGNLYSNGLVFSGSYGYAVGDEYVQFESGYNPGIGGTGAMARITAYRSPEGYDLGQGNLRFSLRNGAALSDVVTLRYDGNVGIGTTTPAYRLDVAGDIRATGQIIGQVAGQVAASNVLPGSFAAGTYSFPGNLGLGVSAPTSKLEVAGDARVDGSDGAEILRVENQSSSVNANGIFVRSHSADGGAGISADNVVETDGGTWGVIGVSKCRSLTPGDGGGVMGWSASTGDVGDVFGVLGKLSGRGGAGPGPNAAAGVYGWASADTGVSFGVIGETDSDRNDVAGVYGLGTPEGPSQGRVHGVLGLTSSEKSGSAGVFGTSDLPGTYGVFGRNNSPGGFAGKFQGDVNVTGTLTKGAGGFKIDHPLNPENMYLYHSFVESPEMLNVYSGNATLDTEGAAIVELSDWFEAINMEFRYQLTAIGQPAPNLHVAEEVRGNQFRIAGGPAGVKVSWQISAVRADAYANAYRIPVEEEKPDTDRGFYLHPELYGAGEDRRVELHSAVELTRVSE